MFASLGKNFNLHLKLFISNKNCNEKYFSILYSGSYKINYENNRKKCHFLKEQELGKYQCRYFADGMRSFYFKLYESVTSSSSSVFMKNCIIDMHEVTGLSWWATLVSTTLLFKIFWGFPIAVYQQKLVAKVKLGRLELEEISKGIKEKIRLTAAKERWNKEKINLTYRQEMQGQWNAIVMKNNCHPSKITLLSIIQFPVWICLSLTLRKLCDDVNSGTLNAVVSGLQFQVGGLPWCQNLALPDPLLILPTIITLASLIVIEIHALSNANIVLPRVVIGISRVLTLLSFLISANIPSAVTLFWAISVLFTLGQNLILLLPRCRKVLRIPKTPSDLEKPFVHIAEKGVEKYSNMAKKLTSFIKI